VHRYLVHILLQLLPHPALQRAVLRLLHTIISCLIQLAHPDGQGLSASEAAQGKEMQAIMAASTTSCWPALTWQVGLGVKLGGRI